MPELPEVEVVRRDLERAVLGRTIASAAVLDTKNSRRIIRHHTGPADLQDQLKGRPVSGVRRRGKFLILDLGPDLALVVHLGMSGQLRFLPADAPLDPHTHVLLDLGNGDQLRYVDPRTFGQMFVADKAPDGTVPALSAVGPDPLTDELSAARLAEILGRHRLSMKVALTNQALVGGVGNIYSDEALFLAGIRPLRTSDTLSAPEVAALYQALGTVLRAAIANRGTSAEDEQYRDLNGQVGGHGRFLNVYQREGEPCVRCATPIQRARWANRSTFFCPNCQH